MSLEKFKRIAAECDDESLIDELCWRWLKAAAEDNGKDGEVAIRLMKIIESELMP
jgi:hypothetical protein